ncbi:unnamed protein product [Pylaiella littoralis]
MSDPASHPHASGVKEEVAPSVVTGAMGNNDAAVGDKERYAAAAAAALAKGDKRSNVAGFLVKAYQIFDNPAWSKICGWGQGGETVVIRKQIDFAQSILPLFFSHSNLQSFVRQLNMYNFRKVVQDPNSGEFKHDLFRKGNEHLLHKIKRKQSAAGAASSALNRELLMLAEKPNAKIMVTAAESCGTWMAGMAGGIVEEADSVLDELVKLRNWKEEMDTTVTELKRDKQTIQSENVMLKEQVAEHHNQQRLLQVKMQKILNCMYEAYISGLRGANGALTGPEEAEGGVAAGDAQMGAFNGMFAAGGTGGGSAGSEGDTAESALAKALQQLAALAGENMSSRINLLDMENPWAGGGGGGGGSGVASAASGGDSLGLVSSNGEKSCHAVDVLRTGEGANGNAAVIVGGGQLKRNRTWSQSSLDWLKSLRGPDPLGSIGTPGGSPAAEAFAAAAETQGRIENADAGEAGSNVRPCIGNTNSNVASARGTIKRQRMSPPKVEPGGRSSAGAGISQGASFVSSPSYSPSPPSPPHPGGPGAAASPCPAGGGGGECVAGAAAAADDSALTASGTYRGRSNNSCASETPASLRSSSSSSSSSGEKVKIEADDRTTSFQPDAPLPSDEDSLSGILSSAEVTARRSIAAAGGDGGSGEIWGGGCLSRTLSEGATQVVSELGEMGAREGQALSKLDSLGYQLASLMDANPSFDGMFCETGLGDLAVPGDES